MTTKDKLLQQAIAKRQAAGQTVDSHVRSADRDAEISAAVHAVSQTVAGKQMIEWLREISIFHVLGSDATSTALHYQEGMRMVTALIDLRLRDHERRMMGEQAQTAANTRKG